MIELFDHVHTVLKQLNKNGLPAMVSGSSATKLMTRRKFKNNDVDIFIKTDDKWAVPGKLVEMYGKANVEFHYENYSGELTLVARIFETIDVIAHNLEPMEVLNKFDIGLCQVGLMLDPQNPETEMRVYQTENFLKSLFGKKILFTYKNSNGNTDKVDERVKKYQKRFRSFKVEEID